jgi:branched-chain amino acid transport system substrate-binding protein
MPAEARMANDPRRNAAKRFPMKENCWFTLFLLLFIAPALISCGDSSPILVGFSGQLTGKNSDLGVCGRNGALLAVEHINEAGGINGRIMKLLAEDDKNTPNGAIEADTALVNAGVVAIIGHMTSGQTMAALPYTAEKNILLVSPTTTTPLLTGIKDNFTRVMVENTIQSRKLASYARLDMDIRTVASVVETDNKSYTLTFEESFIKAFEDKGGTVVSKVRYSTTNPPNWSNIVSELARLDPDAILLNCPAQDFVAIAQRLRTAGVTSKLLSGAWAYTDVLLLWGGEDIEGSIFVVDYSRDNPDPNFVQFFKAYENRFGTSPSFASAFAYESVLTLAEGLKKTGGTAKGLIDAVAPSDEIKGVTGSFKLDEYGDVNRKVFIVTIQNGKFRSVGIQ